MKVKDVFYDILNLRGLMIQTNAYTREVQFNFFDDLIKNKAIAKDWSNKVDVNTSVLSYQFGKYAQRNDLVFKDNSEVTQDLGNFYFNVNDENLEVENTAVQIKHPATEQTNKYLGSNVPSIEGIDALNKWQKPEHRILQMSVQNSSYNVAFEDGTSTLNTTSNIPYCKFEGFDVLVPEYYNALTDILTRTKALGLVLNLTPIDIQSLDFSIPIFLDVPEMNINGYFYINKISNYRQGLTACELIRL
jgi:nitrogen fixation protein FixH